MKISVTDVNIYPYHILNKHKKKASHCMPAGHTMWGLQGACTAPPSDLHSLTLCNFVSFVL
jgi:hypothetical protein